MKKIELIALLTDSKKIVQLIQRRGVVELTDCGEEFTKTDVRPIISEFERFRSTAEKALEILDSIAPEKKSFTAMLEPRRDMELQTFADEASGLEKTLQAANAVIRLNAEIAEVQSELSRLEVRSDIVSQWRSLDVPLDFHGTEKTSAFIGTLPKAFTAEQLEEELPEGCYAETIGSYKEQTNVFILTVRDSAQQTEEFLRQNFFVPLSEKADSTPAELLSQIENARNKYTERIESLRQEIISKADMRQKFEVAVDYLQMRQDKYDALNSLGFTDKTFVLTGYVPEKYASSLKNEIEEKYTAAITISDTTDEDDVPVLLENSRFSAPVEGITEMYALPDKHDVDPTPVMSFFYYFFFGLMLSDAGYGLLMVIGTAIALKKFRLEDSMRRTLTMFRNCGISTIVFGALFGSWFGDIVQVVAREFFGREIGSLALWFEPIDDPIRMLLYSFAFGIAHLFLGLAVAFPIAWKEGRKLDAFLDTVPVYLTVLGAAPLGAGILISVPSVLTEIGKYMAIAGVVLLFLTAGRSSKSVIGRLFGGLYALYNTATGYLGDILSYSRLLALGLATGSIAGVINLIGTMPSNLIVKGIMLVIVFVIGHSANLAINLLGAYVHTDRLQFVELFSKFYKGGGRAFSPLKANTKFIRIKEES